LFFVPVNVSRFRQFTLHQNPYSSKNNQHRSGSVPLVQSIDPEFDPRIHPLFVSILLRWSATGPEPIYSRSRPSPTHDEDQATAAGNSMQKAHQTLDLICSGFFANRPLPSFYLAKAPLLASVLYKNKPLCFCKSHFSPDSNLFKISNAIF
jgi:hypothetical protein